MAEGHFLRVFVARALLLAVMVAPLFLFDGCMGSSSGGGGGALAPATPNGTFENAELLTSPDELESMLGDPNTVIVDLRSASAYAAGHIAGAIQTSNSQYVAGGGQLRSIAELEAILGSEGISRAHTVVAYANHINSFGTESRFFWMLEYLGHTDVHVLDGGWAKWSADGRPTETTPTVLPAATFVADVDPWVLGTKDEIAANLDNPYFVVVDARTDEEYFGWEVYNEGRGGRIPGAKHLPYEWFLNEDQTFRSAADVQAQFSAIGIDDKRLTIASHCTVGIRSGRTYFMLRLLGYDVKNYSNSWLEWANDPTLPADQLPNYHLLVYPGWINALIGGGNPGVSGTPDTYPGNGWVLVDTRTPEEYAAGHIPGAVNLEWMDTASGPPYFNLKPPAELAAMLAGVTPDTTVIVYADNDNSFGSDGRFAWMLNYMGLEDARILNGGWDAWVASGLPTETTENVLSGPAYSGYTINPNVLATVDYVHDRLDVSTTAILDSRSVDEYEDGHIPGAVNYHFSTVFDEGDKTLRNDDEILESLQGMGIFKSKEIITNCAVGIRSGHSYFVLKVLGYENVRNFDGSYAEWSATYPTEIER